MTNYIFCSIGTYMLKKYIRVVFVPFANLCLLKLIL